MVEVLDSIKYERNNGVCWVQNEAVLSESDKREIYFWKNDPLESTVDNICDNVVHKSGYIRIFKRILPELKLKGKERILELGSGHGWASAMVKKAHPNCYIIASDISKDAVKFAKNYESILGVTIDEKWSFSVRTIPFERNQFDRIFTFASFHHFGESNDFSRAMTEMVRVIKPGGKLMLFYEPSSPKYLHTLAVKRVNAIRKIVDEGVVIISHLKRICETNNCDFSFSYFPDYQQRSNLSTTLYYFFLSHFKFFQPLLPCTVNLTIQKG